LALVFITGILGILPFLMPHPVVQNTDNIVRNQYLRIIEAFALVLGLGSIIRHHIEKIRKRKEHWPFSYVAVISFIITSIIGVFGGIEGGGILPTSIANFKFDLQTLYINILTPLGATMFSLLAFFIATSAFRAFRVRNFEATLLLASGFIVMLGMTPLGSYITVAIPGLAQWILDVPNMASKRGILFGIYFGVIATALKVILGIERGWLGGTK